MNPETYVATQYTEVVNDLIAGGVSPAIARKRLFSPYWTRNTGRKPKVEETVAAL